MDTINVKAFHKLFMQSIQCSKEWLESSDIEQRLEDMLSAFPHGSGIDSGVTFLKDKSGKDKLVFLVPYHHMDQNGFYCGWTDYTITLRPTFDGFEMKITGRDLNMTKEYLYNLFNEVFE